MPKMSAPSFLEEVWAKRDLGLTLLGEEVRHCSRNVRDGMMVAYFPICLFRRAVSLAVQGLMMLSEGEM